MFFTTTLVIPSSRPKSKVMSFRALVAIAILASCRQATSTEAGAGGGSGDDADSPGGDSAARTPFGRALHSAGSAPASNRPLSIGKTPSAPAKKKNQSKQSEDEPKPNENQISRAQEKAGDASSSETTARGTTRGSNAQQRSSTADTSTGTVAGAQCVYKRGAECEKAPTAHAVKHLVMLTGPRHGSSFISSLIADQARVLYLGELFNNKVFMAHASIVDRATIHNVQHSLDKALSLSASDPTTHIPKKSSNFSGGDSGSADSLQEKFHKSRDSLFMARDTFEQFAVEHNQSVLFYKILGERGDSFLWLHGTVKDRCVHFIILRRNFLHMEVSRLVAKETQVWQTLKNGLGGNTTKKVWLDISALNGTREGSLYQAMTTDLAYQKVTSGVPGAVFNAQYEDYLAMENEPGISTQQSLGNIRSAISIGLSHAAMNSRAQLPHAPLRTNHADQESQQQADVLCRHGQLTEKSLAYTRQDKREQLADKVTNYEELKHSWPELCLFVASLLRFSEDPEATCLEMTWRLPE